MGRAPCCDKTKVKRGPWSPEEDMKLKDFIDMYGTGGNWIALPQKVGLKRCGKSCRLRWLNYLRPNIKHGDFTEDEDRIIYNLFATIGSRWSIIAAQLPGRTDNDIKNYWNTKLKKKIMGIPQSQRKSNQQQQIRQQQQQHSMDSINASSSSLPSLNQGINLSSQHLFVTTNEAQYYHYQMKEDQRSNLLVFGGHEQSSSSSDGLEFGGGGCGGDDMGFENSYIYGGGLIFEETQSNHGLHEASLDHNYANFGEMLQVPSSTNISFKTQERPMYHYSYNNNNNMH